MKDRILGNWHFLRIFRMAIGVLLSIQAFMVPDYLFAAFGIFISATALFNIGCCGVGGCAVPGNKKQEFAEPEYEEVAAKEKA